MRSSEVDDARALLVGAQSHVLLYGPLPGPSPAREANSLAAHPSHLRAVQEPTLVTAGKRPC
jgi:hypothetical protein